MQQVSSRAACKSVCQNPEVAGQVLENWSRLNSCGNVTPITVSQSVRPELPKTGHADTFVRR